MAPRTERVAQKRVPPMVLASTLPDVIAHWADIDPAAPAILAPGRAVRALAALTEFAQKRRDFEQRAARTAQRLIGRQGLDLPAGSRTVAEYRAKAILKRYGIPAVNEALFSPVEIGALDALPLAFPVAVKLASPDLAHKTEAGAVRLNVADLSALKAAAREMVASIRTNRPEAQIEGVLVQEMASGLEVIVGAVNDAYFGPTVAFGLGGILTELLHDVTHRFAPFDAETAREMVIGALRASRADTAAAVTGIAGPDGGSAEKPVGLVWFAWCVRGGTARVEERRFQGDRDTIRRLSVETTLRGLLESLEKTPG